MSIARHDNDIASPATKELRFAQRLLENANEAVDIWKLGRVAWSKGAPDPSLPPVGERACRKLGDHTAIWLAKSITFLIAGAEAGI
jgi:hypothetical protein